MQNDLFVKTLTNDEQAELASYQISGLFLVSYFGGVIPTLILGTKNSKWLKIDKKIISLLIILGVIILSSKIILSVLIIEGLIEMSGRNLRYLYKLVSVLLYLAYYFTLKPNFKMLISTGGEIRPILKDAIIWI